MKIIQNWWEKKQEKIKEAEFSNARETILFNLSNNLTTEESVNLFKDVSDVFINKMQSRLLAVSLEKEVLENFLSVL